MIKMICSICGEELQEDHTDDHTKHMKVVMDLEEGTIICSDCFNDMTEDA